MHYIRSLCVNPLTVGKIVFCRRRSEDEAEFRSTRSPYFSIWPPILLSFSFVGRGVIVSLIEIVCSCQIPLYFHLTRTPFYISMPYTPHFENNLFFRYFISVSQKFYKLPGFYNNTSRVKTNYPTYYKIFIVQIVNMHLCST